MVLHWLEEQGERWTRGWTTAQHNSKDQEDNQLLTYKNSENVKSDKSKSHHEFIKKRADSCSDSGIERDPGITGDQKKNLNQHGDAVAQSANTTLRQVT